MKKTMLFIVAMLLFSSFNLNRSYPCHPLGDLGPCVHPTHSLGDLGPCTHTYWDSYGNLRYVHTQDLYPCEHRIHAGDLYECQHICW